MISIVVPCYNEEKNIQRLVKRFVPIAEKLGSKGFELILVDNASNDGTSEVIDRECKKASFIRKIAIDGENQGYGYGIIQGLKICKGEWLGWIHADLQLPPEAFLDFMRIADMDPLKSETRYFKGKRHNRPVSDTFFTIGMSVFESLYLGKRLWDINAQPTLIHRSFYVQLVNLPYDFSLDLYVYYMARRLKLQVTRVPVIQRNREEGVSSWNNGIKARLKFIKRTIDYSIKLKKEIKGNSDI